MALFVNLEKQEMCKPLQQCSKDIATKALQSGYLQPFLFVLHGNSKKFSFSWYGFNIFLKARLVHRPRTIFPGADQKISYCCVFTVFPRSLSFFVTFLGFSDVLFLFQAIANFSR